MSQHNEEASLPIESPALAVVSMIQPTLEHTL